MLGIACRANNLPVRLNINQLLGTISTLVIHTTSEYVMSVRSGIAGFPSIARSPSIAICNGHGSPSQQAPVIEQASHIMHAKSMDYQCTHRPPCSSTGSKRRSERRGWLNKTRPKNHVRKKGGERSPTSMATSTAGAKELN